MKRAFFTFTLSIISIIGFAQFTPAQQQQIDSLNQVINESKYDTAIAEAYVSLSEIFYVSNPDTMAILCEKAKKIAEDNLNDASLTNTEKKSFSYILSTALNNIGIIYYDKGHVSKALEYFFKSLTIIKQTNNAKIIATYLNNIGFIYNSIDDTLKALEYYSKSLEIRKEIGDKRGISYSLNNIAVIFLNQKRLVKSLKYLDRSLKIREEIRDKIGVAVCLHNIAVIYYRQKEMDKSLEYHYQSLKIRKEIGHKKGIMLSEKSIATIKFDQGKIQEAKNYASHSLKLANELGYPSFISKISFLFSKILKAEVASSQLSNQKKVSLYKQALEYYTSYAELKDSIQNKEIEKEAIKQEIKYTYEQQQLLVKAEHQKQIAITKERIKKQQGYLISFGISSLLLIMLGVYVFKNQQHKRKNTQSQYEITKLKKAKLENELILKNKELIGLTLRITQNNQFTGKLDQLIGMIKNQSKEEITKNVQDLKKQIQLNKIEERYLIEFQTQFEGVHKDFVGNLKASYPKLTSNELRICSLLKMNMSTIDISSLLGVSVETLKNYRHRIHSKMNLPKGSMLSDFIIQYN